jgi:hypothetical protein
LVESHRWNWAAVTTLFNVGIREISIKSLKASLTLDCKGVTLLGDTSFFKGEVNYVSYRT